MAEITNFADVSRVVYRGSQGIEILLWPEIVGYNTRKRPEMTEITNFADDSRVVYRESQGIEILPWRKSWVITQENGEKCSKSRVLPTPLESCTSGHKASKSSWDPKILGYNQRKRLEMAEITSFVDASRVMYWGSQSIEICQRPKSQGQ